MQKRPIRFQEISTKTQTNDSMEFAFWNTLRVKTKKIGNQLLPSSTDKPRIAPLMAAIPFNFRLPARTFSIFQIVCEAAKLREGVLFS